LSIGYVARQDNLEEVRNGQWVRVPPTTSGTELRVCVGHLLHIWSNGLFQPAVYRTAAVPAPAGGDSSNDDQNDVGVTYCAVSTGRSPQVGFAPVCCEGEKPLFGETVGRQYALRAVGTFRGIRVE